MYCTMCGSRLDETTGLCPVCGSVQTSAQPDLRSTFIPSTCAEELESILPHLVSLEENYKQIDLYTKHASHAGRDLRFMSVWISIGASATVSSIIFSLLHLSNGVVLLAIWAALFFLIHSLTKNIVSAGTESEQDSVDRKIKAYEEKYAEQFEIIYPVLNKYVPQDYWFSTAVEHIAFYFRNRRADTMKEAINLFEEEMHRIRLEDTANAILIENQRQTAYSAMQVFLLATIPVSNALK